MEGSDREASASRSADVKQAGGKRRRWPQALKREVVAALAEPGASVSSVARRYDVNPNQLFKGRRPFAPGPSSAEPARLLPVEIVPSRSPAAEERAGPPPGSPTPPTGSIEAALRGGTKVRIEGSVDPAAVAATIGAVLSPRRRR